MTLSTPKLWTSFCLASLASISGLAAQTTQRLGVLADSGLRDNSTRSQRTLFRCVIRCPASLGGSVRATQLILSGSRLPPGSHLQLTSQTTGFRQRLDALALRRSDAFSAWFDGSAIRVELIAAAGTRGNRLLVAGLRRIPQQFHSLSLCGVDDRLPHSDPRVGRLPSGATAFLIGPDLALTAGHSVAQAPGQLLEFRVPASTAAGNPQRSHPDDQYSFRILQLAQNGIGDDWALLRISPNANTGLIPFQRNGAQFFSFGSPVAGRSARVTGYGSSATPRLSFVQQTATGPLRRIQTTALGYQIDTTTGSSGSPIVDLVSGHCIGIHTNGGCRGGGDNWGTRTDRAKLMAAIQAAQKGRTAVFGQACASRAGLPRLRLSGKPQLGSAVTITIDQLPLGRTGSLALGFSAQYYGPLSLPFDLGPLGMPGCKLYTSLDATSALGTGLGSTGMAIPIPNLATTAGLRIYAQYFFAAPQINSTGIVTTAAGEIVIGF